MKYAIAKAVNGNFSIHAEGFTDLQPAIVGYFGLCQSLWNASDVLTAMVAIVDENLDVVARYKEYIHHEA